MLSQLSDAYPIESKPLNNNPDSWNFGAEKWMLSQTANYSDSLASELISSDQHVKKSKITPKSIFIAPNALNGYGVCPHGFRVDDNGKCLKTVTINQDEVLAARISELFGIDKNSNQYSDFDTDYYDSDDQTKSEKDSGPLQVNIPLAIKIEEKDEDGKKVEFIIEEKLVITMRNLNLKDVMTTTEKVDSTGTVLTEETTNFVATTKNPDETTTETLSTISDDEVENVFSTTLQPTTEEPSELTLITTEAFTSTTKKFTIDLFPKLQKKSNQNAQASAKIKSSHNLEKIDRTRKQKTTVVSAKPNKNYAQTKLFKIDKDRIHRKNKTRNETRQRGTTAKVVVDVPTTQKPFWWLPKGWSLDESKEKPVLVRFWSEQPLNEERAQGRTQQAARRLNSRMPNDNFLPEKAKANIEKE